MTQHDYNLANQSRTSYRTDHNNLNSAILSNNSGSSAPSTTAGCMWWADTTNNLMKVRNPGDSAWLYLANIDSDLVPTAKTGAYTVAVTDYGKLIPCNANGGAFTVTLPAAATAGEGFRVGLVKTDSSANNVTIDGNSSETINGGLTIILYSQFDTMWLFCDGSNWYADNSFRTATQSFVESETSVKIAVTPDRIKYNPGVAKAWVRFNGTGTPGVEAGYNVASITDNGTGDYTVNFTTAFSSVNYGFNATCTNTSDGLIINQTDGTAPGTSSCRIIAQNRSGVAVDPTRVSASFHGDQ